MGIVALAALLGACEPRVDGPEPPRVFSALGGPVLEGLRACPPGEVRTASSALEPGELPERPGTPLGEEGCQAHGCWAWAGWNDRRELRGAGARLSIEAPPVESPDHSLAEVALRWGQDDRDIVELGWEVAPRRTGDTAPHLFVSRWIAGRPCDDCPFHVSSRRLAPGMSLAGSTGRSMAVGWLLWEGRAWAWADGEWLGAFELGPRAPRLARVAQWFGEVFFVRPSARVAMGNGREAANPGAARFQEVCDVPLATDRCVVRPLRLPRVTRPERYGLWVDGTGGFRYGGPGPAPIRPRPPPSSASAGTPPATGR